MFTTYALYDLDLHVHVTSKFRQKFVVVVFEDDLQEPSCMKRTMLPRVLLRGSRQYPTHLDMQWELDNLYGAQLSGDTIDRGSRQFVVFSYRCPDSKYLRSQNERILEEGFRFLGEVLYSPQVEEGAFLPAYVIKEKVNLQKQLRAAGDQKQKFAAERCREEMLSEEVFVPSSSQKIELLEHVNESNLYQSYLEMITNNKMHVYVIGDVRDEQIKQLTREYLLYPRTPKQTSRPKRIGSGPKIIRYVTEESSTKQAKLVLGVRTGIHYDEPNYIPLVLLNAILGIFPFSKLSNALRKENSLAYYANSLMESFYGVLFIETGIEQHNYPKALNLINQQLTDLRNGYFTHKEVEKVKHSLIQQFKILQDSAKEMIFNHLDGLAGGKQITLDDFIKGLMRVTYDDLLMTAQELRVEVVYLLQPKA